MLKKLVAQVMLLLGTQAGAQSPLGVNDSASNLMVVLRESPGLSKQTAALSPVGKIKVKLPDGGEAEYETGWFEYIGDMHLRFVFDAPEGLRNASPRDLERLGLNPEMALETAVANIRRVYGEPKVERVGLIFRVQGKSRDFDSSYFLYKVFWDDQLKKYPDGLVVGVASRDILIFAPLASVEAVEGLRTGIANLHASSEGARISSALYLYKDGKWTLFQEPVAAR